VYVVIQNAALLVNCFLNGVAVHKLSSVYKNSISVQLCFYYFMFFVTINALCREEIFLYIQVSTIKDDMPEADLSMSVSFQ